ncbi:carboxypeptidase-like regulatory domain-containing protein [bacterium]|nr:carboxypeptidase-like regulatory domain-containing protein [bacterium]
MRYLIILLLLPVFLHAQEYRISGEVVDKITREPIIGANVIIEYHSISDSSFRYPGAATGANGGFIIILKETALPRFLTVKTSYIGYRKLEFLIEVDSATSSTDVGAIEIESTYTRARRDIDRVYKQLFNKDHTNFRSMVTWEDIRRLPNL